MPLTTKGISLQIISSIRALRDHPENCSENDCKLVVNHLIRKFSEPAKKTGQAKVRLSAKVHAGGCRQIIKDHAVPVIVLLNNLLTWADKDLIINNLNISRVEDFLIESLLLVAIDCEEDLLLSNSGFQRAMPPCWSDKSHIWYRDPLARYRQCLIDII